MKTKTVLIIDDSHLDRYIITEFLSSIEGCDYEFIECSSAEKGLSILDEIIPDCILLDNILPGSGMNGVDALPFIKKTRNKLTPIIMITGTPTPKIRDLALSQGVSYFMDKLQLSPELLHSVITDLVDQNETLRQMTI